MNNFLSIRTAIGFMIFLFLISCGKKVSLDNFDSALWKGDKKGCNGERTVMIPILNESKDKVVGMKRKDIIRLFGNPESTELHPRGQLLYRYYLTPSPNDCKRLEAASVSQIKLFEIRLNALGIASEAMVVTSGIIP
jgi:hypothetical protein